MKMNKICFSENDKQFIRDNFKKLSNYKIAQHLTNYQLPFAAINSYMYRIKIFLESENLYREKIVKKDSSEFFNVDSKNGYCFLIGKY